MVDTTQNLSETHELLCGLRGCPRALFPLVMDNWVSLALAESILLPPAGSNMKQHCPIVNLHPGFFSGRWSRVGYSTFLTHEPSPRPPRDSRDVVGNLELSNTPHGNLSS